MKSNDKKIIADDKKIIQDQRRNNWLKTFAVFSALNFVYSNVQYEKTIFSQFIVVWILVIAIFVALGYDIEISPLKWRSK